MKNIQEHWECVILGRRISHAYWFSISLYLIWTTINHLVSASKEHLLISDILIQGGVLILTAAMIQVLTRVWPRHAPYITVIGSNIGAFVIVTALYASPLAASILLLPLIASVLFLKREYVVFAFVTGLVNYVLVSWLTFRVARALSYSDSIIFIAVFAATACILLSVIQRGREILDELETSIQVRQEMLVDKIVAQKMVKLDGLTGLNNRTAFEDYAVRSVELCHQNHIPLHLAVLDIDNFKLVNDVRGHLMGDEVLKAVANDIAKSVPSDYFVARYGGEEFLVLAADVPHDTFVMEMERIRVLVEQDRVGDLNVTVSIGIHSLQSGEDLGQLIQRADENLYRAKHQGKNQVVATRLDATRPE